MTDEGGTPVTLYVYDLSHGLASEISPFLLGEYRLLAQKLCIKFF